MSETMFVRLKPYDPLRSQVMIDWTAPWGTKYVQGEWHEIDPDDEDNAAAIEFLREIREHVTDLRSPRAFNICTYEEALQIMEDERKTGVELLVPDERPGPKAPTVVKSKRSVALNRSAPAHELEMRRAPESAKAPTAVTSKKAAPTPKRTTRRRRKSRTS